MRTDLIAPFMFVAVACSRPDAPARPSQMRPESVPAARATAPAPALAAAAQAGVAPSSAVPGDMAAHEGCGAHAAAVPAPPNAAAQTTYGQPIDPSVRTARLGEVLQAPQQYSGSALRLEGQVVAVCQHMGCWMEMRNENTQAHVRMHGHSFFVPRGLNGHRAQVQATLVAAHPSTECDESAQAATGRPAQLELEATGVQVLD